MTDTASTPPIQQVRLAHLFEVVTAAAVVMGLHLLTWSSDTFVRPDWSTVTPPLALLFALDLFVKVLAVLGIVTLLVRLFSRSKLVRHPAEFLWFLLGAYVLCQPTSLQGLVLVAGGLLIAYRCRSTSWMWFYLIVALAPVICECGALIYFKLVGPTNNLLWITALQHALLGALAFICVFNTKPTRAASAGIITQLGLAIVTTIAAIVV